MSNLSRPPRNRTPSKALGRDLACRGENSRAAQPVQGQPTGAAAGGEKMQTTTIAAVGGIVVCALLALRDPAAREQCRRIAQDPVVRRRFTETIRRLARDPESRLEGQ